MRCVPLGLFVGEAYTVCALFRFYVNIYTRKSQWDRPSSPVYPPSASADVVPPDGPPPPSYGSAGSAQKESTNSNAKYDPYGGQPSNSYDKPNNANIESDAAMAARLQAEEDELARGRAGAGSGAAGSANQRNAMNDYMNTPMPPTTGTNYADQELPPREKKAGLLGRLMGGGKHASGQQQQQYPQQQQYDSQQQQPGYGPGYPPAQQYPPGGYANYAPQGYAPQGYAPVTGAGRASRPGMGAAGGAALGLGGGLLGGMVLGHALDGGDHGGWGGDDGGHYGGDDGGYGGDDGGDYGGGGDDGGGDFGGD